MAQGKQELKFEGNHPTGFEIIATRTTDGRLMTDKSPYYDHSLLTQSSRAKNAISVEIDTVLGLSHVK